jgi:hypothetical protein
VLLFNPLSKLNRLYNLLIFLKMRRNPSNLTMLILMRKHSENLNPLPQGLLNTKAYLLKTKMLSQLVPAENLMCLLIINMRADLRMNLQVNHKKASRRLSLTSIRKL